MVDRGFHTKITKVSLTLYSTFASKLHLIAKKDAHSVLEIVSDQSYLDAHFQLKILQVFRKVIFVVTSYLSHFPLEVKLLLNFPSVCFRISIFPGWIDRKYYQWESTLQVALILALEISPSPKKTQNGNAVTLMLNFKQ